MTARMKRIAPRLDSAPPTEALPCTPTKVLQEFGPASGLFVAPGAIPTTKSSCRFMSCPPFPLMRFFKSVQSASSALIRSSVRRWGQSRRRERRSRQALSHLRDDAALLPHLRDDAALLSHRRDDAEELSFLRNHTTSRPGSTDTRSRSLRRPTAFRTSAWPAQWCRSGGT